MGWVPGLVTVAGSLLNRVHLGKGGSQALERGQEVEKAAPESRGPPSAPLSNCAAEQAGGAENNLQELNITGRGHAG